MDKDETINLLKSLVESKNQNSSSKNQEFDKKIFELHKKYGRGILNVLRSKSLRHLVEYLDNLFPMLKDPKYSLGMKIFWLENDITDFPICQNQESFGKHQNKTSRCNLFGYSTVFCCGKCEAASNYQLRKRERTKKLKYGDPHYRNPQKAAKTMMAKTGFANPFSNPEIIEKMVEKKKASGDYCNHRKMVKTRLEKIRPEWRSLTWRTRVFLEKLEKSGVVKHLEAREFSKNERTRLSWKCRTWKVMKETWKKFEPLFTIDEWIDAKKFEDDLTWKCKKCGHVFKSCFNPHYEEYHRCVKCDPFESYHSKIEQEMQDFIESVHSHPSYDRNTKRIIGPVEIDDYIRDLKVGFEMNGLYTHSNKFKKPGYHTYKTKKCDELGIHLIHIFEDEWKNQCELCKSSILKVLKDNSGKLDVIDASKCKLVELEESEAFEFFENNSLRWKSEVFWDFKEKHEKLFKIYGLKKENNIVFACIVLKNNRLSFDLMHFSEKAFVSVPNALKTIVEEVSKHAKTVTCNLDKRWYIPQEKEILEELGFEFKCMVKARFFWVNYGYDRRISQMQMTKQFALEIQKTLFWRGFKYDDAKTLEENLVAGKCEKLFNAGEQHWLKHITKNLEKTTSSNFG